MKEAVIKDYIKAAEELGLTYVGFTDHSWDEEAYTPSPWYEGQNYPRLMPRYEEVKGINTNGINVMLGAEGEYAKEVLCITEKALKYTDYIIVPHSHTHMNGVVLPEECNGDAKKHAQYLVNSFISLCNHQNRKFFFGIAHPMYPIGKNPEEAEKIYSYITDEMLENCVNAAKNSGIVLEFNLSVARKIMSEANGETCYHKFLKACKNTGIKFFLGSDAHSIEAFKTLHQEKISAMEFFAMAEEDFVIVENS